MTSWSNPSEAYKESLVLHLRLHQLAMMGYFESCLADELRDGMDAPWNKMTEPERDRVRDFAANLNLIEDALKKE